MCTVTKRKSYYWHKYLLRDRNPQVSLNPCTQKEKSKYATSASWPENLRAVIQLPIQQPLIWWPTNQPASDLIGWLTIIWWSTNQPGESYWSRTGSPTCANASFLPTSQNVDTAPTWPKDKYFRKVKQWSHLKKGRPWEAVRPPLAHMWSLQPDQIEAVKQDLALKILEKTHPLQDVCRLLGHLDLHGETGGLHQACNLDGIPGEEQL